MENKIYDIISSWASIPTWHTGHPLDRKRFSKAMKNLVDELGTAIDIDAFEAALRRHAETNPGILGNPQHWDQVISDFVIKAETIFVYEDENKI